MATTNFPISQSLSSIASPSTTPSSVVGERFGWEIEVVFGVLSGTFLTVMLSYYVMSRKWSSKRSLKGAILSENAPSRDTPHSLSNDSNSSEAVGMSPYVLPSEGIDVAQLYPEIARLSPEVAVKDVQVLPKHGKEPNMTAADSRA
ncbi:hypothetical protein QCA50_005180 [Cerrena zonata]|uniref:Uncharacterized protein n=1 Tax=Cerrena zonata TaxID=2478898 RepID=A0AAW0GGN9_9APHY